METILKMTKTIISRALVTTFLCLFTFSAYATDKVCDFTLDGICYIDGVPQINGDVKELRGTGEQNCEENPGACESNDDKPEEESYEEIIREILRDLR